MPGWHKASLDSSEPVKFQSPAPSDHNPEFGEVRHRSDLKEHFSIFATGLNCSKPVQF